MNKFILLCCTLMFFSCAQDNTIVPNHVLTADQKIKFGKNLQVSQVGISKTG